MESATKFLGGHSDVIAGVVAGRAELIRAVDRIEINAGATIGPLDAFLVLRGILTLGVRAERHSRTAAALAAWLEDQVGVQAVLYPGLASHPQHAVADRQFRPGAFGGMLAFEVVGGRAAGKAVIEAMTLPELTASLGSVHTMVVHPPSTSQRQLTDAELADAGITPGLLRVSVGLEDLEDLQADVSAGPRSGTPGRARARRRLRDPAIATPTALSAASARSVRPNPIARVGQGLWRLLTSVNFAVAQIIVIVLLAIVGMTIKQLPDFAFRSASDYALAMDQLHIRYDPLLGAGGVDILERLSVFQMFRSVWFSAALSVLVISIVVCTLDRTPRLWRGVSEVRVAQPEPFFDPILPDRAAMIGCRRGGRAVRPAEARLPRSRGDR